MPCKVLKAFISIGSPQFCNDPRGNEEHLERFPTIFKGTQLGNVFDSFFVSKSSKRLWVLLFARLL